MSRLKTERIEEAKQYANTHGGECISIVYLGAHKKLAWRCRDGHEWESTFTNVVTLASWCRVCCGKAPRTLADAQQYAREMGGECLSATYENNHTPLLWRCEKGHEWTAPLVARSTKSWCPKCSYVTRGKARTLDRLECGDIMAHARGLAEFYGGRCVSSTYRGCRCKLTWECGRGHRWMNYLKAIDDGAWCRRCRTIGRSEELVRQLMEHLTGESFERVRPRWLLSPKGNPLELDGYNDKLKLAFEYQGAQHYNEASQFSKRGAKKKLETIQRHDAIKVTKCAELGVLLLQVPHTVGTMEMEEYLRSIIPPEVVIPALGRFTFCVPAKPKRKRRTRK